VCEKQRSPACKSHGPLCFFPVCCACYKWLDCAEPGASRSRWHPPALFFVVGTGGRVSQAATKERASPAAPAGESPDVLWLPGARGHAVPTLVPNSRAEMEPECACEPGSRVDSVSKNGRDAAGKTADHSAVAPAPHPGSDSNSRENRAWYRVPGFPRPGSQRAKGRVRAENDRS
jgi:hypothetical protein